MNLIYVGKLVNTHGLKGEVRLISDFKFKEDVFKESYGNLCLQKDAIYGITKISYYRMEEEE